MNWSATHLKPGPVDTHILNFQQSIMVPVNVHAQVCQIWVGWRVKCLVKTTVSLLASVATHQAATEADRHLMEADMGRIEEGCEACHGVYEVLSRI